MARSVAASSVILAAPVYEILLDLPEELDEYLCVYLQLRMVSSSSLLLLQRLKMCSSTSARVLGKF